MKMKMEMVASEISSEHRCENRKIHIIVAVCSAIRTASSLSVPVRGDFCRRPTTRPSSSPVYTFCAKGSIQLIAELIL